MTDSKNGKKSYKARHISMIAIGGCIGTGLFMASGAVVSKAGSYGAVVTYALIGVIIYFFNGINRRISNILSSFRFFWSLCYTFL